MEQTQGVLVNTRDHVRIFSFLFPVHDVLFISATLAQFRALFNGLDFSTVVAGGAIIFLK